MFQNIINLYTGVLTSVREHIPDAVLAGGCLRDSFYGVEVKDLDFVVPCPREDVYPVSPRARWLQDLWPDKQWQYADAADYVENEENGLLDVVKSTDNTVNFIIVRDIPTYTNQFPDSISKMVFDGERVHTAFEWGAGNISHTVYYRPTISEARRDKLWAKYPTWVFMSTDNPLVPNGG